MLSRFPSFSLPKLFIVLKRYKQALMFLSFCLGFTLLNIGINTRLEPSVRSFVSLPYIFDGNLEGWEVQSGKWLSEGGVLEQSRNTEGVISSPLYLSETGLRFSVQLEAGAGISFFKQNRDSLKESHVVYVSEQSDGLAIVAGYITQDGSLNTQSRYVYKLPLAQSTLALSIETTANSYSIFINNDLIVEALDLNYQRGWLALSSAHSTRFEGLMIDKSSIASTDLALSTTVTEASSNSLYENDFSFPLERQWRILSGNWRVAEGQLWQYISEGFDYTALYPESFSDYQIDIEFEQSDAAGAGLVFNLPSLSGYEGGHLVRFTHNDAGEEGIFWGFYNDEGDFVGQGYLAMPLEKDVLHSLRLDVSDSVYSIYFNGELIRDGLPLQNQAGFLGLTVSQSTVAFEQLQIRNLGKTP